MTQLICKICGKKYKGRNQFVNHLKSIHKISVVDYFVKHERFIIPKCICGKNRKYRNRWLNFYKTCSKECFSKISQRPHSEITKKHLSIQRKEYLRNNKQKHNWSLFRNEISDPEKQFEKILSIVKGKIYRYYKIPESERGFEIDFAIPELKIGFEINGNQHYERDGTLKQYYQERHNHLEGFGWKIILRFHISCVIKKMCY